MEKPFSPKIVCGQKMKIVNFLRASLSYRIFHIINRTSGTIVPNAPRDIKKHARIFKIGTKRGDFIVIFSLTRPTQYIAIYWTRYLVHPKVISYWAGCLLGIANNRYYRDISISIPFLRCPCMASTRWPPRGPPGTSPKHLPPPSSPQATWPSPRDVRVM